MWRLITMKISILSKMMSRFNVIPVKSRQIRHVCACVWVREKRKEGGRGREREKEREDKQDVSKSKIFMRYKGPCVVKTLWRQNKVAKALPSKINTHFKNITVKTVWMCEFWQKIDKQVTGRKRRGERAMHFLQTLHLWQRWRWWERTARANGLGP